MNRTELINQVIAKRGCRRYLEIGVSNPKENFDLVQCPHKTGVDTYSQREDIIQSSSDAFFQQNRQWFDAIFIDGDHRWTTVLRDVTNALSCLLSNGVVFMHDILPVKIQHTQLMYQRSDGSPYPGNGTAWKAYAILRMSRSDLKMIAVDEDSGVGILIPQSTFNGQELFIPPDDDIVNSVLGAVLSPDYQLDWQFYTKHRQAIFNPVSGSQALEMI